jgi:membrane protease subunit (stomatin/prohibitin family)
MNKYQEALNNLIKVSCPKGRCCKECDFEKICNCEAKSYIDTLQELVDKATPKKADIWGDGYDDEGNLIYDMYDCPNCGTTYEVDYHDYKYCPNCGQKIDQEIEK